MTTTILNALSIYYKIYDDYRQTSFQKWCAKYAQEFDISLRLLVTNDVLYSWYQTEWNQVVENQFMIDTKDFIEAGVDDPDTYQELFFKYPQNILEHYPKALLNKIRIESRFKNEFKTKKA